MNKKISFDNLPAAVEKVLEILTASGSDHTALLELIQRINLLEKRFDNIERLLSPNRATMDKQTVLRVLKLRPKQLNDLESSGILMSHKDGRSSVYYEDDVVRFYMKAGWKAMVVEASKAEFVEPISEETNSTNNDGLIDVEAAAAMIGRAKLTIYNLTSQNKIPFIKKGRKLYFEVEKLKEWMNNGPTGVSEPRNDVKESKEGAENRRVDINGASKILGRTSGAIRQHLTTLPHHREGNKLYFFTKDLIEWDKSHKSRKRKKADEN